MTKKIPFESEYILHNLTQIHLKELFELEFIASEIQLNNLRLDNLAFDMKTGSFVIIEYKNELNLNVLNQAQDYYELIKNNNEFFMDRLQNKENVDFENVRIMIIGPEFTKDQIDNAKDNVELWKVTLFDDGEVEYENLNDNTVKTLNINLEDLKLTEEMLLEDKTDEMKNLYFNLKNSVLNEFEDAYVKILVDQVAFKVNDKIISVVRFQKSSFNIYIYGENLSDTDDLIDISNKSTGGNANYNMKYESDNDLNYFLSLFKQVYNQKVGK